MIFATNNSEKWHSENLKLHYDHYAQPMRTLGSRYITKLQRSGGARVYYHPFVDLGDGNQLKYGVMSMEDLENDLSNWSTMFVAGRLHKPTMTIQTTSNLRKLQERNMRYALNASLLLMPSRFDLDQLFLTLTSLSYGGDPRFDFGAENSNKVSNIVNANRVGFMNMYMDLIESSCLIEKEKHETYERLEDEYHVLELCRELPESLRSSLGNEKNILDLHKKRKLSKRLRSIISSRVRQAAPAQYAKGILTAGVGKSLYYLKEKFSKGILSKSG